MFGGAKFDESSAICQTKPSKLVVTINNHLADLFIHQTFFTKVFIDPLSPNVSPPNFPAVLYPKKRVALNKNDQSTNSYYIQLQYQM